MKKQKKNTHTHAEHKLKKKNKRSGIMLEGVGHPGMKKNKEKGKALGKWGTCGLWCWMEKMNIFVP